MAEPLDLGDDDYPDVDALSFPELVELHEVMEWQNAEAFTRGEPLPHPDIGVPPPPDPGEPGSSPLVSRAGWGARDPVCRPTNIEPEGITIHWSGPSPWTGVDRSSVERFLATASHSRCPSIWRAFENFHMDVRNGCMIFYTSGACPHGVRFEGRGPGVRTGAQGTNDGNLRSYAVQTLTGIDDPFSELSKSAALDEEARLGVPFRWGHRDWRDSQGRIRTECPGPIVYDWRQAGFPDPIPNQEIKEVMAYVGSVFRYYQSGKRAMLAFVGPHRSGLRTYAGTRLPQNSGEAAQLKDRNDDEPVGPTLAVDEDLYDALNKSFKRIVR